MSRNQIKFDTTWDGEENVSVRGAGELKIFKYRYRNILIIPVFLSLSRYLSVYICGTSSTGTDAGDINNRLGVSKKMRQYFFSLKFKFKLFSTVAVENSS